MRESSSYTQQVCHWEGLHENGCFQLLVLGKQKETVRVTLPPHIAEHQEVMDTVTHGSLFQLDAPTTANISVLWSHSRGMEGQRRSVCLCSRLCFKALLRLSDIIPAAKLLKVNGPQDQKKPGEGLLPGVHISAQGPLLMLERARNLWKIVNA